MGHNVTYIGAQFTIGFQTPKSETKERYFIILS